MAEQPMLPVLLTGFDGAWARLDHRLVGLSQSEYVWEPAVSSWTVRDVNGTWLRRINMD
jgi:hypothetical protein